MNKTAHQCFTSRQLSDAAVYEGERTRLWHIVEESGCQVCRDQLRTHNIPREKPAKIEW